MLLKEGAFAMDYTLSYLLVLLAIGFSLWASHKVNGTFEKYSRERPRSGMTGYDAARRVLDANGLQAVRIEQIPGELTDHFDPRDNVIRLSASVYGVASTAAVGVAAHEAGHAIQYAESYAPLKVRNAIVPITNIGSRLSMPLIILGLIFSGAGHIWTTLAYVGVACFSLCVIFQLVTLPTEFNASRRAMVAIETSGMLTQEELYSSEKVLSAAAMTYVAALAVSVTQLLRLLSLVQRSDRR